MTPGISTDSARFPLFIWVIRILAMDTSLWSDDVWVVDSTLVECGRSRETARRSDAAGWAEYGYCASHTRYFWGLRLHLVCTLTGLARPSSGTRTTSAGPSRQTSPGGSWCCCARSARARARRAGQHLLRPLRQVIESVNWTFKGQLDLERARRPHPGGHHRPRLGPDPGTDRL